MKFLVRILRWDYIQGKTIGGDSEVGFSGFILRLDLSSGGISRWDCHVEFLDGILEWDSLVGFFHRCDSQVGF